MVAGHSHGDSWPDGEEALGSEVKDTKPNRSHVVE
jgi:hypothetical protein